MFMKPYFLSQTCGGWIKPWEERSEPQNLLNSTLIARR
jgi:hypothetical protein